MFGLVGNKKDLYMNEVIDEDTGRNKADEIGALFKLTSAKNETQAINDYLVELLEEYLRRNGETIKVPQRRQTIESSVSVNYKAKKEKNKSNKCCT